jgi:hypothetical protein
MSVADVCGLVAGDRPTVRTLERLLGQRERFLFAWCELAHIGLSARSRRQAVQRQRRFSDRRRRSRVVTKIASILAKNAARGASARPARKRSMPLPQKL